VIFTPEDIAGAVADLGTDAMLDDGTLFRGVFRNDTQDENLTDARVEGTRSSITVSSLEVASLDIKKGTGITVAGRQYIARRVEAETAGLHKVILAAR
jgi:hypothetical protein